MFNNDVAQAAYGAPVSALMTTPQQRHDLALDRIRTFDNTSGDVLRLQKDLNFTQGTTLAEDGVIGFNTIDERDKLLGTQKADKYALTFNNEISRGRVDSRRLHHPSTGSGVTIGPGYDMLHLDEAQIRTDLVGAGIDTATATSMAAGARLSGTPATTFASNNANLQITDEQEKTLFDKAVPTYEQRAKRQYDSLVQRYQTDARYNLQNANIPDFHRLPNEVKQMVVDYTYNTGANAFPSFFAAILRGDQSTANTQYMRYTPTSAATALDSHGNLKPGFKRKRDGTYMAPLGRRNTDTRAWMDNRTWDALTN